MTPFSQYCIWLNSENTVRIVIKRLKERIALSQVLLTDVVSIRQIFLSIFILKLSNETIWQYPRELWIGIQNDFDSQIAYLHFTILIHKLLVQLSSQVNSVLRKIINLDDPLNSIKFPLYAFELPHGADPADFVIVYNRHYVTVDKYFIGGFKTI